MSLIFLLFTSLNFWSLDQEEWLAPSPEAKRTVYDLADVPVFLDASNEMTISDILEGEDNLIFTDYEKFAKRQFRTGINYWAKLNIKLPDDVGVGRILEMHDHNIYELEFYQVFPDGSYTSVKEGSSIKWHDREMGYKNFTFPLNASNGENQVIFVKISSPYQVDTHFAIKTYEGFLERAVSEYVFLGGYYGIFFLLFIYCLASFIGLRERLYLLFLGYIIMLGIYFSSRDGLGFQYFWPSFPIFNVYSLNMAKYVGIIIGGAFYLYFFKVEGVVKNYWRFFWMGSLIWTVIFLVANYAESLVILSYIFDWVPPFILVLFSIVNFRRSNSAFKILAISIFILGASLLINEGVVNGIIPFNFYTHYFFRVAYLFHVIMIFVALGDRLRLAKLAQKEALIKLNQEEMDKAAALEELNQQQQENIKLANKVNEELEQKVAERTTEIKAKQDELELANEELAKQAEQIHQMNILLDTDNYKLKKKWKEERSNRVKAKRLEYEEFLELFPDELACYRHLENIKWSEGYECLKCGNEKFFKGSQKFARRCTKCGYNESITTNTAFQGVKFSIQKAFYIAYVVNSKFDITQDKLAKILDLRIGTVNAFNKKLQEYERKHKNEMEFL
ncbi:7TM diverse intracellular signaling domain-containing protein [Persicobacter diffluens]|uniref:7TM diverse intracellular signaling domain-containing protein n=1 Tax=Persicobacter diffluens TaxID=981 RepID=UPI0030C6F52E